MSQGDSKSFINCIHLQTTAAELLPLPQAAACHICLKQQNMQAMHGAAHQSQAEYQAGFEQRCPKILGSVPCEDGSAKIDLHNGRTCPLIAIDTHVEPSLEALISEQDLSSSIVCLSLSTTSQHHPREVCT